MGLVRWHNRHARNVKGCFGLPRRKHGANPAPLPAHHGGRCSPAHGWRRRTLHCHPQTLPPGEHRPVAHLEGWSHDQGGGSGSLQARRPLCFRLLRKSSRHQPHRSISPTKKQYLPLFLSSLKFATSELHLPSANRLTSYPFQFLRSSGSARRWQALSQPSEALCAYRLRDITRRERRRPARLRALSQ